MAGRDRAAVDPDAAEEPAAARRREVEGHGARAGGVPVDHHAGLGVDAARQSRSGAALYVLYGMENH